MIKALEEACEGLLYISETDAPIEVLMVRAQKDSELTEVVRTLTDTAKGDLGEQSPDDFFERLTDKREWYGEREKRIVKRYKELRKRLESNLSEITLFRTGRVRVDIYVIGFDKERNVVGIRTKAVET